MKRPFHCLVYAFISVSVVLLFQCSSSTDTGSSGTGKIMDHLDATLVELSTSEIENAKLKLHIAYGHTSHGSQLISGMIGLVNFKGDLYAFNNGGTNGALDLRDTPFSGASDLGNPNRTAWADATRNYLNSNEDINVVIWSWCGQVSNATEEDINTYLSLMTELEGEYTDVFFVYMTGHLDGSGEVGNLNQRNDQIREYCRTNNKFLYDFADIESYDPDGETNYMLLNANDACDYDSDGNGSRDTNWAEEWREAHEENVDWYQCSCAHSDALNGNQKAYAAWALWVSIAKRL